MDIMKNVLGITCDNIDPSKNEHISPVNIYMLADIYISKDGEITITPISFYPNFVQAVQSLEKASSHYNQYHNLLIYSFSRMPYVFHLASRADNT